MCKISDYPALWARVEEELRVEKIRRDIPGYELLKKAIVIYKIDKLSKSKLIEEVQKISLVPSSEVNLQKKNRTNTEQWMIEAIKSIGYEDDLMVFIEDIANRI